MRRVDYMVGSRDFKTLRAEQFMQSNVFSFHVEDTGGKLALAMTEWGFGSVPVVDQDHRVVGIVSEFDLLKAILKDRALSTVTAGEIMTPNPITAHPEDLSTEIVRVLEEKHLIRLPVVDSEGKLVGIVARRDILQGYLKATTPVHGF